MSADYSNLKFKFKHLFPLITFVEQLGTLKSRIVWWITFPLNIILWSPLHFSTKNHHIITIPFSSYCLHLSPFFPPLFIYPVINILILPFFYTTHNSEKYPKKEKQTNKYFLFDVRVDLISSFFSLWQGLVFYEGNNVYILVVILWYKLLK